MISILPRYRSTAAWAGAFLVLFLFYSLIWTCLADKYQNSDDGNKYVVSSEIYKRLLFSGDIEGIDRYTKQSSGNKSDILASGYSTAASDERPLYFLYLALIKTVDEFPVGLNFACGMAMLLSGLLLLFLAFDTPNKPLCFLVSGLFLSPFTIHQAYAFEPHALQTFLSCVSVFFYARKYYFWAFFFMTLSFFSHGANLVLLGCFGIYFLYQRRFAWNDLFRGLGGCIAAWVSVELFLALLFSRDSLGLIPHSQFLVWMLTKSARLSGQYAMGGGIMNYFKNALILLPLGTIGLLWVKDSRQFALTVLPLALFAAATRLQMPGALRVLLPVFFLGYAFFWDHLFREKRRMVLAGAACLVLFAGAMSAGYLVTASRAMSLSYQAGIPVAVCKDEAVQGNEAPWLYRNVRRFHPVSAEATTMYCLRPISRLEISNIPDPNYIQANLIYIALSKILPPEKLRVPAPQPPIYTLERRSASREQ